MSTEIKTYPQDILDAAELFTELINRAVKRQIAVQPTPQPSEKVDRDEAARIIGCKPRTIYEYVAQGKLKPIPTGPRGGKNMFLRSDVEALALKA